MKDKPRPRSGDEVAEIGLRSAAEATPTCAKERANFLGDGARISLSNASFPSALPAFPLVKSRINVRIRRNSNWLFILYYTNTFVEIGFVRIIFAILTRRAHLIEAARDRVRIAHVA